MTDRCPVNITAFDSNLKQIHFLISVHQTPTSTSAVVEAQCTTRRTPRERKRNNKGMCILRLKRNFSTIFTFFFCRPLVVLSNQQHMQLHNFFQLSFLD